MSNNRVFNAFVVGALVVMAALTIRQVVATTEVVSAASGHATDVSQQQERSAEAPTCAFSEADRHSLTSVYVKEIGSWLPRTDSGFTGFEGGLLSLRDCPALKP